jgi:uncharacterized membrane protein
MWSHEQSAETNLPARPIWEAWADVERWPEWNGDIEQITINGPFATGSTIAMTPKGQDSVELRIAELTEGEEFIDEADLDGTVIRTLHRLEPLDGDRLRVVYRLQATGPAAEDLGPAISADFAETIAALLDYAAR